jgi:DNA polymerase III epsilon subunit-like protein
MSADWRADTWVVIDSETTGTDIATSRIVEIGIVEMRQGDIIRRFSTLLNPCEPIPEAATAIHGISDADVASAPTFQQFCNDIAVAGIPCAYNARFDKGMLIAEYLRAGVPCPAWLHADAHWIDPLVWARARDPYAKGGHKLTKTAERLGVTPGTAHRAAGDCETTAKILRALATDMPSDFDEMIMQQRVLAAERELNFIQWLSKQPKREAA